MATVPWEVDQRSRSSTWPVPDPEQVMDPRVYYQGDCQRQPMPGEYMELPPEYDATIQPEEKPHLNTSPEISGMVRPSPTSGTPEPKKPRNPWGEMSYADLITKAILSAPEKRLTLSEIYTWMIENVPYFREKANETSTSGWKNSIRHNLSLHDRFQKLPNEKTGKSSWWTVSPDVKGTKSSRRPRSSSIDTPGQPAKPKKEKRKTKKAPVQKSLSVDTTAGANSGVSPCASPTGIPRLNQWSPLPNSPGGTSSPVLPRTTRAVTTSSPLLSPQFSTPQANLRPRNFDGSSNSLNETDQRDEAYSTQASTDSLNYDSYPPTSYSNQIHDRFGSSSSLSSINSPLARLSFGQTAFPFPSVTVASGCTSPVPPGHPMSSGISSGIQSDVEMNHRQDSPVVMSPPPYEEAVQQVTQTSTPSQQQKFPLTMQHSFPQHPQHPLHISNHFKRPRSTSMPIAIPSHFPADLDTKVFQNNFNIDVDKVLRTDLCSGGPFDFSNILVDGSVTPVENDAFMEQSAPTSPPTQQQQQQQQQPHLQHILQPQLVQCPPNQFVSQLQNPRPTGGW